VLCALPRLAQIRIAQNAGHAAGANYQVTSYQHSPGIVAVTSISAYKASSASTTVDGLVVTYTDGEYDNVGSLDAINSGVLISKLDIAPGDKVKELYLWTNSTTAVVQGIHITMTSSSSARLAASNNRSLAQPTLKGSGSDLGTGLLLGVTTAVAADGPTLTLSAIGFTFLNRPVSTALAVDMPAIDIDSMQFEVQEVTDSSVTVISGSGKPPGPPDPSKHVAEYEQS
jgi:hypothetical protein